MISRVGLDLDHTIIDYTDAFRDWSLRNDLKSTNYDKHFIKSLLLENGGDEAWQRFQGWLYSEGLQLAKVYRGAREFVARCSYRDIQTFVVSHKTLHGHFDSSGVNLRDEALRRLDDLGFLGTKLSQIDPVDVLFVGSQSEKISKIAELEVDVFIDDLAEIVTNDQFPPRVKPILFTAGQATGRWPVENAMSSWHMISEHLFGPPGASEVSFLINVFWPDSPIAELIEFAGGANSRAFFSEDRRHFVKLYRRDGDGSSSRCEREALASKFLEKFGLPVPHLKFTSDDLALTAFEFLPGERVTSPTSYRVNQALDFVRRLQQIGQEFPESRDIGLAKEATLSASDYFTQIQTRLDALRCVTNSQLQEFLETRIVPSFSLVMRNLESSGFAAQLGIEHQVLSPSDFGFHNAIVSGDQLYFVDFEYFGWDDPARLVGDFLLHPAMSLTEEQSAQWMAGSLDIFSNVGSFDARLKALLPAIGLRWQLIMLKPFTETLGRNTTNQESRAFDTLCNERLAKASTVEGRVLELVG